MAYIASVDRSSFPAHVSKEFSCKKSAVKWAKAQKGYSATVYTRIGWANVWSGR